jgi:hypothetical protein
MKIVLSLIELSLVQIDFYTWVSASTDLTGIWFENILIGSKISKKFHLY